ncbi:MAG: serine hydrolase, partial [Anaerolineaceae bacterium]
MMNHKRLLAQLIGLTFLLFLLVACGKIEPTPTPVPPTARPAPVSLTSTPITTNTPSSRGPDYWPTDGWRSSAPEEQGMDSEMLAKMFESIEQQNYDIHSVTIIRNGYIVADATIYPFEWDSKHQIHSVTKSISSALVGIAIDQGYIENVNQPVLSLFPNRLVSNNDANKEAMTLEHLLTMTTGLECRDSYLYRWRGLDDMMQSDDWVQHVLDLPMVEQPGSSFEYCNGASFLLSAIIQETTGMTAAEFAEINLFDPLGISDVVWPSNPRGVSIGWGGLRMQPRDMAKIGYLYLNEGRWEGKQIISPAWVDASTSKHIDATLADGYGYQWWTTNEGHYFALGYAGQYIFVAPELEMVTVITSNFSEGDFRAAGRLLEFFILPAVKSDSPLPPNPGGFDTLEARIQNAALAQSEPEPIPPLP